MQHNFALKTHKSKIILTMREKEFYHLKTLHAQEITPPSSPFPKQVQEIHQPSLFQSCFNRITTSEISESPQMTFLIVSSSLIYFTVHQSGTTSSNTFNQSFIPSSVEHLRWSLFAEIANVLKPLVIFAGELHCGCFTGF